MLIDGGPFYAYHFGTFGPTLDTARQTPFFEWFHLAETERRAEAPGSVVRFRPTGDTLHDQCYLDLLITNGGDLVRTELVLRRSFVDGADRLFAQDLLKSFLLAVLPDACRHLLADFMLEVTTLGGSGRSPGMLVVQGRQDAWDRFTGWSHLVIRNLPAADGRRLVVQTGANPAAPNAVAVS